MRATAVEGLNEEWCKWENGDNTAYDMCFDGTNENYSNCIAVAFEERQVLLFQE